VNLLQVDTWYPSDELVVWYVEVGDDGMEGCPARYEIRYALTPIYTESDWSAAVPAPTSPGCNVPGVMSTFLFHAMTPLSHAWLSVRAVDDEGNVSPLGNTLEAAVQQRLITGTIRDASSQTPIPNVAIEAGSNAATSGADGSFEIQAVDQARLRDEQSSAVGQYFDMQVRIPAGETHLDLWMIPNTALETTVYADFLEWFERMTTHEIGLPGILDGVVRRWELPIRVYVPPLVKNGLDYEKTIKNGFRLWETLTGMSLFEFTNSQPTHGAYIRYVDPDLRDLYDVLERDADLFPTLGRVSIRSAYDPTMVLGFTAIAAHEAGHVLGLGHSNDTGHLMVGWKSPGSLQPTEDEIDLVRVLYRLPRGVEYKWFLRN
jgi:hypothetical protein